MNLLSIVIFYLVVKFLLPLILKAFVRRAKPMSLEELEKIRCRIGKNNPNGSKMMPSKRDTDLLDIKPQPKAKSKLVVAEPYSMEDLDHDESQHQAKIKPSEDKSFSDSSTTFRPTNLRQGFIMAELLGKPKAIKEWGEEW